MLVSPGTQRALASGSVNTPQAGFFFFFLEGVRELGEEIFGRSPLRRHSGSLVQMSLRQECRLGGESERTAAVGLSFRSKILWRQQGGKGEAKSAAVHLRVSQLRSAVLHCRKEMIYFLV